MQLQLLRRLKQIIQKVLCPFFSGNILDNPIIIGEAFIILVFSFKDQVVSRHCFPFKAGNKALNFSNQFAPPVIRCFKHLISADRTAAGLFTFFHGTAADAFELSHNQSTPKAFLAASTGVE